MADDELQLTVVAHNKPLTLDQFAHYAGVYLSELKTVDQRFSCLAEAEWSSGEEFASKLFTPKPEAIIDSIASRYNPAEDKFAAYKNLAADNTLASNSLRDKGWDTPILYTCDSKTSQFVDLTNGGATVYLSGGSYSQKNASSVQLKLSATEVDSIASFKSVSSLFRLSIEFYARPLTGQVFTQDFLNAYQQKEWVPDKTRSESLVSESQYESCITVGWFTFVNFAPLPDLLPSDIDFEVLPNGGTLIYTTRERCSAANARHVKQARYIHYILQELHLQQSQYALQGWPADEQESAYEKQITGAPDDRKYLVEFCYFDGYDANRDILLYAKLFRVLGVPESANASHIHNKAYLAEAWRQLAAVDAANASTPIEWHIGIEKHATTLANLFDQHHIPTKRLKIIYTPYRGNLNA